MRLPAFGPTQVFVQLVRMGLGLLQGHHLGVRAAKPVPGLLAGHSPRPFTFHDTSLSSIRSSVAQHSRATAGGQGASPLLPSRFWFI